MLTALALAGCAAPGLTQPAHLGTKSTIGALRAAGAAEAECSRIGLSSYRTRASFPPEARAQTG